MLYRFGVVCCIKCNVKYQIRNEIFIIIPLIVKIDCNEVIHIHCNCTLDKYSL